MFIVMDNEEFYILNKGNKYQVAYIHGHLVVHALYILEVASSTYQKSQMGIHTLVIMTTS